MKAHLVIIRLLSQFTRQGVGARLRRQVGVEGRVKHGVLGNFGQLFEADLDHGVGIGVVDGGQRKTGTQFF